MADDFESFYKQAKESPKDDFASFYAGAKQKPAAPVKEEPVYDVMGVPTGYTQPALPGPSKAVQEFERKEGPFGYAKEYGKGVISSALGTPAELTINLPSTLQSMGLTTPLGRQVEKRVGPIPRAGYGIPETEKYLFGEPKSDIAKGMRTAGEVLGVPSVVEGYQAISPFLKAGKTAKAGEKLEAPFISLSPEKAIEKTLSPATSVSAVGEKLENKITTKLDELLSSRRNQFKATKDNYLNAGRAKEDSILNDYINSINQYYAMNADRLSADEINLLKKSVDRLRERPVDITGKAKETIPPGFDAVEKERRFLNDVAQGLKVEGAEAIPATFAKDLSRMVENSIQKYVPKEFETFNTQYQTLSEPINRYNSVLGGSVIRRADDFLPEVSKIDPAKIPDKFFDSRRSVNELRALTGDEAFVQQAAKEHIANDLRGVSDSKAIKSYINQNYDWLQELPQIRNELNAISSSVAKGEVAKTLAKWAAGGTLVGVVGGGSKFFGD